MVKLLLKYMIGLIILAIFSIIILYMIANRMQQHGFEKTMQAMNQGVFYSLEEQLKHYPETQWPAIIKKLQPENGNKAAVLPISEIHLPKEDMQRLLSGEFVVFSKQDIFYFGYGATEPISYKRIANTNYVIQLQEIPMAWVAKRTSAWMTHLVELDLQYKPKNQWPNEIKKLENSYGFPLTVFKISDNTLPKTVINALVSDDFVLEPPSSDGKIKYAYTKFNNSDNGDSILRIGPIPYPIYLQYKQYILILIFSVIAIAFIILLTLIFSRNLDKIYSITEKYSQAVFTDPPKFSKYSTLRTLYENILKMGNRIKNLMESQSNLTRFIAHECRTPISTMLFAIDNLEKETLSKKAKANLDSIKSDLSDLNLLVSEFLNYARHSAQEIVLEIKTVNIKHWIYECLDKYKAAPKKIILNWTYHLNVECDPTLMKHVISNLLNNSLRYAVSKIQIIIELQNKTCLIHVDDDGRKINDADKDTIFDPFVRLNVSTDESKSGFGLGLTIAETIVKRHQGHIEVSDSPLGGSRFTISLPILG